MEGVKSLLQAVCIFSNIFKFKVFLARNEDDECGSQSGMYSSISQQQLFNFFYHSSEVNEVKYGETFFISFALSLSLAFSLYIPEN